MESHRHFGNGTSTQQGSRDDAVNPFGVLSRSSPSLQRLQHQPSESLYVHYTISQDHTGGQDAVAGMRLAALGDHSRGLGNLFHVRQRPHSQSLLTDVLNSDSQGQENLPDDEIPDDDDTPSSPLYRVGDEAFCKIPRGFSELEGKGIYGIIKKVWQDRKPVQYDVQEIDDATGIHDVIRVIAEQFVLIPASGAGLPTFSNGSKVHAKYPETNAFYSAKVRNYTKGMYTLIFEREEEDREIAVDKRFVFDARTT